jgi:hypothetical protein
MLFKDDFPNKGKKRAISRPFAIAIRAARLYTAWLAKELIVAGWLVDRCLASKEPDKKNEYSSAIGYLI